MRFEDFRDLATPAYVFSADELAARFARIRTALGPKIRLVYAMKANPFVIEDLLSYVDAFEVCSPGEMHICEKAGVPGEKMVLSGVCKAEADFRHAVAVFGEKPVYTVESPLQMAMLERVAEEAGCVLSVLLRVTNGNQFGMDEETVTDLIRRRETFPHLSVKGLQLFTGTQKKARTIERELASIDAFIARLADEEGFVPEDLEYGPGLAVEYFEEGTAKHGPAGRGGLTAPKGQDGRIAPEEADAGTSVPVPEGELTEKDEEELGHLKAQLAALSFRGRITLEMGRFIAAYCGYYVTAVCDKKTSLGVNYLIMDGGIHQITYHGQTMAMKVPYILCKGRDMSAAGTEEDEAAGSGAAGSEVDTELYTLCGSLCTYADVLVREVGLPGQEIGDRLVFTRCGAYAVTEGISLFLSRDLPSVYIRRGGVTEKVREKIDTEGFNHG